MTFYSIVLYIGQLRDKNKEHCEINNNHRVTALFHHKTKQHRTSLKWTEQHCRPSIDSEQRETALITSLALSDNKHLAFDLDKVETGT